MTPSRPLSIALAMLLAAQGAAFSQAKAQPVSVSDAKQLVAAIGPGKTIVLKKGDYRLSEAYGTKNKYVSWNEGDDGKELSLSDLENLTIRGADGARIVSDSGMTSILGIFSSKNVTFDNIRFARLPKKGAVTGAGSFYAESVQGLTLDRCSFEGPTTIAIELWECTGAAIKRCDIAGASSGALSASYTKGIDFSSSRVKDSEGYPLLYLEESDQVRVKGTAFEGISGGNFLEIYAESGGVDSVAFEGCSFKDVQVEYFAGSPILPSVLDCQFSGSSFDENWESDSVAPASDEAYYGDDEGYGDYGDYEEEGPLLYEHPSGLSFYYPSSWEMEEYPEQSRVGAFAPDGKSLVFFLSAYDIPPKTDPAKQSKKVLADAYAALAKLLKSEAEVALALKPDGEPYTDNGLLSADYLGAATKGDGAKAVARARLIVYGSKVQAMVALAADASSLEAESEIDGIFASVEASGGEGE
jgi:hypothetical protein